MKLQQYRFRVPLYGARVLLVKSTPEAFINLLRRYVDETSSKDTPRGDGQSFVIVHDNASPMMVIWLPDRAQMRDPYWLGVLTHECYHGSFHLLKELGMKSDASSEEAFAYMQSWLVEQCMKRLVRQPRKGARKK